jgi:hypothetical protein
MGAAFERVVQLQLAQLTPEAAKTRHIATARAGLAAFMARQSVKPDVLIEVDGHKAASEDSVKPFGVITYRFRRMREIYVAALARAEADSPVRSGRYKRSWFLMVNGVEVAPDAIPAAAEVLLVNDQPYARKIHVGSKGFEKYANPGVVEKVRQWMIKQYGRIAEFDIEFVTLSGGYKLAGNTKLAMAQLNRRSSVFRAGGTRLSRRKDLMPGAEMTYPALKITPRRFV